MKGTLKSVGEHVLLRKGLVTFQFAVALLVLVAAFVITRQVTLFFGGSLGYNKEFMVSAQVPRDWSKPGVDKMISIRDQFAALPEVTGVALSYEIPNGNNGGQAPVYKMGADTASALPFQILSSDEKYLDTYGIALKEGRPFDGYRRDSGQVLLNETGARALGYTSAADAVGKKIQIPGDPTLFTVKGITGDFHFGSMLGKIPPILIFNINFNPTYRFLSFRLKPGNVQASLEALQRKWSALIPETAFEYRFMDDDLRIMYARELQLKKAAYVAGILALVIVLLGIFSLVSLSIQKRIKEIGVRKVLGASASSIIRLLAKEFIVVLLVAVLVAVPLGYWLMSRWLQHYAYHIKIAPEIFVIAFFLHRICYFFAYHGAGSKSCHRQPCKVAAFGITAIGSRRKIILLKW